MKLVDIPVIFICPDHNEKYSARKQHMSELLQAIGFKSITHFKSGTDGYPNCLVNALIDILSKQTNDSPVIILEDDVEPYVDLNSETEVDIPEDTDAFYLGFCKGAGSKVSNWDEGSSIINMISDKYIRILNMLGGHAILYNSKRYKERVVEELRKSVGRRHHSDIIFSRLHSDYNVYGYHYPFFYQSKVWDGAESPTRFRY